MVIKYACVCVCKELCVEIYCQETRIIKMEINSYVMTERDGKKRKYIGELAQKKEVWFGKARIKKKGKERGFKLL